MSEIPITYTGDRDTLAKKLSPDQSAILQAQLADYARLNEMKLHSPLRDSFFAGDTVLPRGTLLHGTLWSPETVKGIAAHGIVSGELFGTPEDAETNYCADFWRVPSDTTISGYCQGITGREPNTGTLIQPRREKNWLPHPRTKGNRIAAIIDAAIPEIQPLLEADAYRPGTDELFSGIITRLPIEKDNPTSQRLSAILGGVPAGAIAGLLISPDLAKNAEALTSIREAFHDETPLLSVSGERI